MIKFGPFLLRFREVSGYALDLHTEWSEFVGYNEFGHPQFDNHYTPLGSLLYAAKYKSDREALYKLADFATSFIGERWKVSEKISAIVPMPPSTNRAVQPVTELANSIARQLGVNVITVEKGKTTPPIKGIEDPDERVKALEGAFLVQPEKLAGETCLVIDDLFRSGTSLRALSRELLNTGAASRVYFLAITKTRSRR